MICAMICVCLLAVLLDRGQEENGKEGKECRHTGTIAAPGGLLVEKGTFATLLLK